MLEFVDGRIECFVALLNLTTSLTTIKVTLLEAFQTRRMDTPEIATSILGPFPFDEAFVDRQVVSYAVTPRIPVVLVVGVMIRDPLVYVSEHETVVWSLQECISYEVDVGHVWFSKGVLCDVLLARLV